MTTQNTYDVFICYSPNDLDEVNAFVQMLRQRIPAINIWIDTEEIEVADDVEEKIITAIDASSYVIFVLSENSYSASGNELKWIKNGLKYAKHTGKKVIPVLLSKAKLNGWFLFEFGRVDYIDGKNSQQLEKFLKNISTWTNKELIGFEKGEKEYILTAKEHEFIRELQRKKRIIKIADNIEALKQTIMKVCRVLAILMVGGFLILIFLAYLFG